MRLLTLMFWLTAALAPIPSTHAQGVRKLKLAWKENYLTVAGEQLPGRSLRILYIEAYCRPGSTDREWGKTMVGHTTRLVSMSEDATRLELECTLKDGVVVRHVIRADLDQIDFRITATNPTAKPSEAHWAQPCVEVDRFTGGDRKTYLGKCFVFVDGKLTRMPFDPWATKARYVPGQVWCPKGVPRTDVNPRPLSEVVPSNGLIGCFSADEKKILAVAFEPYQELFQGVRACIHADFRIGGLKPGETKKIKGKLYVVPADVEALLKRYARDFPTESRKN